MIWPVYGVVPCAGHSRPRRRDLDRRTCRRARALRHGLDSSVARPLRGRDCGRRRRHPGGRLGRRRADVRVESRRAHGLGDRARRGAGRPARRPRRGRSGGYRGGGRPRRPARRRRRQREQRAAAGGRAGAGGAGRGGQHDDRAARERGAPTRRRRYRSSQPRRGDLARSAHPDDLAAADGRRHRGRPRRRRHPAALPRGDADARHGAGVDDRRPVRAIAPGGGRPRVVHPSGGAVRAGRGGRRRDAAPRPNPRASPSPRSFRTSLAPRARTPRSCNASSST